MEQLIKQSSGMIASRCLKVLTILFCLCAVVRRWILHSEKEHHCIPVYYCTVSQCSESARCPMSFTLNSNTKLNDPPPFFSQCIIYSVSSIDVSKINSTLKAVIQLLMFCFVILHLKSIVIIKAEYVTYKEI